MLKMCSELERHALNGPTMGSRWSALIFTSVRLDLAPLRMALQTAVDEVNIQMSTWIPDSDLMRLNAAPVGAWVAIPPALRDVLRLGLEVGHASGGAFEIGLGDAVSAWGFGPAEAAQDRIKAAMTETRVPAAEALEITDIGVRKIAPVTLDLNGIAKGYGVDRLAETLLAYGFADGLVGIDGDMRALGLRPNGAPWAIAVESPDPARRAPRSIVTLQDASVATSGDYRHCVNIGGRRLSHTMDPARRAPLIAPPASVTVVARSCAEADAWATALMVLGSDRGAALARARGLDALFLLRDGDGAIQSCGVGPLFQPSS